MVNLYLSFLDDSGQEATKSLLLSHINIHKGQESVCLCLFFCVCIVLEKAHVKQKVKFFCFCFVTFHFIILLYCLCFEREGWGRESNSSLLFCNGSLVTYIE